MSLHSLKSSEHSLDPEFLCHSCYPDRAPEMSSSPPFEQQKHSASCCQGSCHRGKEKEKVPKLVLNLIQELSIFLEAPREQMLSWFWRQPVCWKGTISRLIDGGQSVSHAVGDIKDRNLVTWKENKMYHVWSDKSTWKTFQEIQSRIHVACPYWCLKSRFS